MLRSIQSLLFLAICHLAVGQSSLHYTLNKGDKFVIQQVAKQNITQLIEGVSHELENNISGLIEFKVTAVKEDNYELDMSFLELKMQMSSNMQGELMNINASQVNEGDVQSKIFNSLLHVPVQIILAKNGNILAVNGGDSLIVKMTEASGLTDQLSKNSLRASLEGEFGSKALSESFEQMTYIYPDFDNPAIKNWKNEYSGKLAAKNSWTLEKTSDMENHIKGEADITMNIDDSGTSMSLKGKQETTITADPESGFILDMLVEGYSEGTAMTSLTGDVEIPTTVRSTTTYKLIQE